MWAKCWRAVETDCGALSGWFCCWHSLICAQWSCGPHNMTAVSRCVNTEQAFISAHRLAQGHRNLTTGPVLYAQLSVKKLRAIWMEICFHGTAFLPRSLHKLCYLIPWIQTHYINCSSIWTVMVCPLILPATQLFVTVLKGPLRHPNAQWLDLNLNSTSLQDKQPMPEKRSVVKTRTREFNLLFFTFSCVGKCSTCVCVNISMYLVAVLSWGSRATGLNNGCRILCRAAWCFSTCR